MEPPATALRAVRDDATLDVATAARLFAVTDDLLAVMDLGGRFVAANPAWERLLGWSAEDLAGMRFAELVHPDDLERTRSACRHAAPTLTDFPNRCRHRDGSWRRLLWNAHLADDRWYAAARDMTDRMRLQHEATHDPLTGLPNRMLLMDRTGHALARLARHPGQVAVLFVDVDRFKTINDSFGHEVGDCVLKAVAERLQAVLRDGDTVARIGGDEFVVVAEDVADRAHAATVAQRVQDGLQAPVSLPSGEIAISASVGMVTTSDAHSSPEALLREADTAMYRAKARGPGQTEVFDEGVRSEVRARLSIERQLREAVAGDELRVHFQPIVAAQDGTIFGCEALVRWQLAGGELVTPGSFLPLAEENGLIVPLGEWVMERACTQAAAWRRAGHNVAMSVNVSPRQLAESDLVGCVRGALRRSGLPAALLCLELTETAVLADTASAATTLLALRELGVSVAIDDFGKGFSSLSHLTQLPVDMLKIDRSFVADIERSANARAIVAAVLALAQEMGLRVVAEGVETERQLSIVRELGCPLVQGFLFAMPEAPEDLRLDGFASVARPGVGDPSIVREFMRQIGIPARIDPTNGRSRS